MSRLLLTAAVLAVLVYTMVLGVRWLTPRIEQDIADRVTTSLAQEGLLWADVSVQGREVTLSGEAPSEEAMARAVETAGKVFGVAKVESAMEVGGGATVARRGGKPYAFSISKEGDKVVLSGTVASDADKAVLMRLADTHYGAENVDVSGIDVAAGAPAGWRSAVGTVLYNIFNMEMASATFSNTEVMVSGTVMDAQYGDQMEESVKATLPQSYKVAFAVDVVSPTTVTVTEVEPAAGETTTCAALSEVKKERLMFDFDKAKLQPEHEPVLARVAEGMDGCDGEKMVVAGFTDKTGSALYNKWLSEQRAQAAVRGLMRKGVDKARLTAVGYGENYAEAENTTREGRAKNRRVEFHPGAQLPHEVKAPVEVSQKAAPKQVAAAKIAKPWWAKSQMSPQQGQAGEGPAVKAEEKPWLGDTN